MNLVRQQLKYRFPISSFMAGKPLILLFKKGMSFSDLQLQIYLKEVSFPYKVVSNVASEFKASPISKDLFGC